MSGLGFELLLLRGPSAGDNLGTLDDSHDGTLTNGAAVVANTEVGGISALSLDGANDFVSIPAYSFGSGDFSCAFWVKLDSDFNQDCVSNRNLGAAGTQTGFVIGHNGSSGGGTLQVMFDNGLGDWIIYQAFSFYTVSAWMHIAVTFDNANGVIAVYRNGVSVLGGITSSGTPAGADYTSAENIIVGGRPNTINRCLDGLVDGVAIFNSVLSQFEITELYTGGRIYDRPADPVGLGFETAIYRGDSGVVDLTGNGYNATQVGGLVPSDDGGIDVWHFDDIDDGLSLPLASLPSAYPCAISFWCKKEAGDSIIGTLSTSSASTPFMYFGIDNSDGKSVLYANPAATIQVKPTTVVGDNAWAFIVLNFESASSRTIRVNDSIEATNTTTGPVLSSFNQFNFGRLVRTTTVHYKGRVNDIHTYDRALTPEEITELYTGGQNYNRPVAPTFNPSWAINTTQVC